MAIVDPNSGKDVVEEMEKETSASGGSSNRETPQPVSTHYFSFGLFCSSLYQFKSKFEIFKFKTRVEIVFASCTLLLFC